MESDGTPHEAAAAAAAAPTAEAPASHEHIQLVQDQATAPPTTTTTTQETDDDAPADAATDAAQAEGGAAAGVGRGLTPATPMSKNQRKKLLRQQKWEDMRDDRKRKRKEKRQVKLAVKRAKKAEAGPDDGAEGSEATATPKQHTLVPVSLIFDCDFEALMTETELISLSSQITRSYAANRAAANSTRIYVSSWGGKMRTRYETLLTNQHKRWQNVFFLEGHFQEAGRQASAAMRGEGGGELVGALAAQGGATIREAQDDAAATYKQEDLVYLTSDSPHTLTSLAPYTSYVIGGIVDKNREKGLCYRRAEERGIRTAKLPIGEYMVMASRQVLTTNQVVEIMLAWLETGNWATAFSNVIPKRKGGHLKGEPSEKSEAEEEAEEEAEAEAEADAAVEAVDTTQDEPKNGQTAATA